MRRGAIAGARVANAAFFLVVSAYGFLSYSPFAYEPGKVSAALRALETALPKP